MMRLVAVSLLTALCIPILGHISIMDSPFCCSSNQVIFAAIHYQDRRTTALSAKQLLWFPMAYRDTIESSALSQMLCERHSSWVRVVERRLDARIVAVVCCDGTRRDTLAFGQDVMEIRGVEYEIDTTLLHGVAVYLPDDHRRSIDEEFRKWYRK